MCFFYIQAEWAGLLQAFEGMVRCTSKEHAAKVADYKTKQNAEKQHTAISVDKEYHVPCNLDQQALEYLSSTLGRSEELTETAAVK